RHVYRSPARSRRESKRCCTGAGPCRRRAGVRDPGLVFSGLEARQRDLRALTHGLPGTNRLNSAAMSAPALLPGSSGRVEDENRSLAKAAGLIGAATFASRILAAPGIVWLLAPGFHGDPSRLAVTTYLTRIMFPYLLFISLAALAMGVLNSLRAFAAPALSPVLFNLFIIGCALFLSPLLAEPILGVAVGVVAGGAAQFAM